VPSGGKQRVVRKAAISTKRAMGEALTTISLDWDVSLIPPWKSLFLSPVNRVQRSLVICGTVSAKPPTRRMEVSGPPGTLGNREPIASRPKARAENSKKGSVARKDRLSQRIARRRRSL